MDLTFHGTDDRLEAYALGRLPGADLPALEEHLLICAACRDRVDGMEALAMGIREALRTEPPTVETAKSAFSPAGWFEWLRRPAFLGALAFLSLVVVISVFSHSRPKFAPVAILQLAATRGEMPLAEPTRELDLTLSDGPREGGAFRIEVVDARGHAVWGGLGESSAAGVRVKAQAQFGPGDYFLRLRSASGDVLREYGFRIRR